jgi:hypothetical protein
VEFRIHPMGPIQSLARDKYLSKTIDMCDFRVAHDNGGRDAGVAADDDDNDDVGAVSDQNFVGADDD